MQSTNCLRRRNRGMRCQGVDIAEQVCMLDMINRYQKPHTSRNLSEPSRLTRILPEHSTKPLVDDLLQLCI